MSGAPGGTVSDSSKVKQRALQETDKDDVPYNPEAAKTMRMRENTWKQHEDVQYHQSLADDSSSIYLV